LVALERVVELKILMEWSTELGGVGAPFISPVENIDVGVLHYLTSLIGTGQVRRNSNSK
jgi:hypothetical protein